MDFDFMSVLELIISAAAGGGLVAIATLPEIKKGKKLDNAERILAKYDEIIKKLEDDIEEKNRKIEILQASVTQLTKKVTACENTISTLKTLHNEDQLLRCTKINCGIRYPKLSAEQKQSLIEQKVEQENK